MAEGTACRLPPPQLLLVEGAQEGLYHGGYGAMAGRHELPQLRRLGSWRTLTRMLQRRLSARDACLEQALPLSQGQVSCTLQNEQMHSQ